MRTEPLGVRPVDLDETADALLAGRAADGDVAAFAALVRRHAPSLRAYARRILGSTDDVDDVVQDTFITAWQQLPALADPASVRGWLVRITNRKAIDRIRARRPHDPLDEQAIEDRPERAPEQVAEAVDRRSALDRALAGLPTQQRRAWVMYEAGGLGYTEIAEQLGVPVPTVRGLLARARKQLLQQMAGWR